MAVTESTESKANGQDDVAVEAEEAAAVEIKGIAVVTMLVPILGTSELIVHRFSEKAKKQMLDAMQGRRTPKEPKNPPAEYEAAFYRLKDGSPGLPANAFKQASVGAARFFGKDVTMVGLRQQIYFHGEPGQDGQQMARIIGDPYMREDVVRVGRGTDLRYRPGFPEWSTTLTVTYVRSALTQESVLSLIDAGGMGIGVGEWRPEKNGEFGQFRVDNTKDIEVVDLGARAAR